MQVVQLNISQIAADKDFNVRETKNYGDLDSLATQILVDGQRNPIEVGPQDETGKYPLISGFRRVAAIRKIAKGNGGDHEVFVIIREKVEPAEAAWSNLVENIQRNDLTSYEIAKGLARMKTAHSWSPADIVKRMGVKDDGASVKGMSKSNVTNLVSAFETLSPKALDAWQKEQLNNEAVFRLKTEKDHDTQNEMLPYIKGKSGSALVEAIAAFEQGDAPEAAPADSDGKKKRKKPGHATRVRCEAWAKAEGLDDVVAVFRWLEGKSGVRLKVGGKEFDPKAKEDDSDEE